MSDITRKQLLAAWAVHAFTGLGAVMSILAMAALIEGDFRGTLLWLGAALLIDGLDGPLARRLRVTEVTPGFDGAILDHIIDYTNYTLIPAGLVLRFELVPAPFALPAAAFMAATALYCFGNKDMKTQEHDFRGFPAIWNLAVLVFYITESPPWVTLAIIALLGVLTFAPLRCVHPLRVKALRPLTLAMTAIWAALTLVLLLGGSAAEPAKGLFPVLYWVWIAVSVYFLGLSAWRSIRLSDRRQTL